MPRAKKKPEPEIKLLGVKLPEELYVEIEAEGKRRGMKVSTCIRQLARERLDELKKGS